MEEGHSNLPDDVDALRAIIAAQADQLAEQARKLQSRDTLIDKLKAQLAVIPRDVPVIVVGGVKPDNMRPWLDAGAAGFGLGSGLYKPGQSAQETLEKARAYVAGVRA